MGNGKMMSQDNPSPFNDLPAALVDEVIRCSQGVGERLLASFEQVRTGREKCREQLSAAGLLRRESDLENPHIPTSCGVDGSYAVERLLTTDLAATAAVAVEGLTPPSEKRFWPEPKHQVAIEAETHNDTTGTVLRGLMITMELALATQAPHDLVFLDGSMTTPVIYLNQSLSRANAAYAPKFAEKLKKATKAALAAYLTILKSPRSDKCWVFCPKYTTNREIGIEMEWPASYDDRGMLTMLLDSGEFTDARDLQEPESPWHINTSCVPESDRAEVKQLEESVVAELKNVSVIYYKPTRWLPTLRLEVNRSVATNRSRLACLLHGVKLQCGSASIMEPYPLYLADRMVKSLPRSIPAFRQVATQSIAAFYTGSLDEVFYGMHGYRTESGG
ncbi:MAG: DNA double-strand break repair nuclease NurA [Verrucomicrobiota bacterium]|jgi:hypothetical protein